MLHMAGREMRYPAAPETICIFVVSFRKSKTILSRPSVRRRYSAISAPQNTTNARDENMRERPAEMYSSICTPMPVRRPKAIDARTRDKNGPSLVMTRLAETTTARKARVVSIFSGISF